MSTITGRIPASTARPLVESRFTRVKEGRAFIEADFAPIERRIYEHYTSNTPGEALAPTQGGSRTTSRGDHRVWPALAAAASRRIGQFLCGLRGHDAVLHYEGKRVMMRCTSCGHDSPGWDTSGRAPRQRYEGDPSRHAIR